MTGDGIVLEGASSVSTATGILTLGSDDAGVVIAPEGATEVCFRVLYRIIHESGDRDG